MYRRYVIVGIVFFLLVGAYFAFFYDKETSKEYEEYYERLVECENYEDHLKGVKVSIDEVEEENRYSYIITFDNVSIKQNDVKILVVGDRNNRDYYPSFGIIDNKGYSLVNGEVSSEFEKKGVNLAIVDQNKIETLLIYYSSNNLEQFVKINVSDYLS